MYIQTQRSLQEVSTSSNITFQFSEEAFWFVAKLPHNTSWKIVSNDNTMVKTCTMYLVTQWTTDSCWTY